MEKGKAGARPGGVGGCMQKMGVMMNLMTLDARRETKIHAEMMMIGNYSCSAMWAKYISKHRQYMCQSVCNGLTKP